MRVKMTVLVVLVVVGVGAALGFAWPFGRRAKELKLPGTVEIHEVRLGPRVAGRVKEVLVKESYIVKAGQELVRLDVPDLEAQKATSNFMSDSGCHRSDGSHPFLDSELPFHFSRLCDVLKNHQVAGRRSFL